MLVLPSLPWVVCFLSFFLFWKKELLLLFFQIPECLVLWFCVSLLCDRHHLSSVHPYRVGVPVVGRTVFRLPIELFGIAKINQSVWWRCAVLPSPIPPLGSGLSVFFPFFGFFLFSSPERHCTQSLSPHRSLNNVVSEATYVIPVIEVAAPPASSERVGTLYREEERKGAPKRPGALAHAISDRKAALALQAKSCLEQRRREEGAASRPTCDSDASAVEGRRGGVYKHIGWAAAEGARAPSRAVPKPPRPCRPFSRWP